MPSPFLGMDPYLEEHEWSDFHHSFVAVIREILVPQVDPHYVVRIDRRKYEESASEEFRESFLLIREQETLEVITVLELLSPNNKRKGSKGRRKYLSNRKNVLQSESHLVELDLLRGGERLPLLGPVPDGDYYAVVSRERRRPTVDVYAWTLQHRLPVLPIPLKPGDADVPLDLQAAFNIVYDRVRYQRTLHYGTELVPPLSAAESEWASQRIREWRAREEDSSR
jgi:hypothetical protein